MASAQDTVVASGIPKAIIAPPLPLSKRINLFLRLWSFKLLVKSAFTLLRFFKATEFSFPKPTYIKSYPVGPRLENHVWIPRSYESGTVLPLYIDIHGGGFAIGDPQDDATYCDYLANKHGVCVVSINYRKAPLHPFPSQTQDVVEIVQEVLKDPDLPVDRTRVAMGGFSAGGNHSLAVALREELQEKLKALVLWYPVTDFSGVYKGEYQTASDGSPDMLLKMSEMFNYGYVSPGQDRKDPFLSPIYADRSRLPAKLFFIGAERDVLCHEAEQTAEMYAKAEGAEKQGSDIDWVAGGIFWKKVLGAQHGFNFVKKRNGKPGAEAQRLKITEQAYADVAAWLKQEVYS